MFAELFVRRDLRLASGPFCLNRLWGVKMSPLGSLVLGVQYGLKILTGVRLGSACDLNHS